MKERHAKIVFIFGAIGVICFLVVAGFVGQLFRKNDSGANTNTINAEQSKNQNAQSDPFVTVVPKEVLGGKPQPLPTDPQRGAAKPTITLVEFGDFECQSCAAMDPIIDQLVKDYPNDILHVWKDFPIPTQHPHAEIAAQAARCAQKQNDEAFWQYHDLLFSSQDTFILEPWVEIATDLELDTDAFTQCLESGETESLVVQGYFIGRTLSVEEAPTYYINNRVVSGQKTYEELKEIIDNEINEAKNATK